MAECAKPSKLACLVVGANWQTLGAIMSAIAVPVTSRRAAFISLLTRQKASVIRAAVIVPEKARVNNETLTITGLFTNFSLMDSPLSTFVV